MADISRVLALFKITMFGISILLALIYMFPIVFLRRFHHRLDILTVNICVAIICTSIYWMNYFIMWEYYIEDLFTKKTCTFLFYLQSISICLVPFSFLTLTIHRLYSIVYFSKAFFKTKKFVAICIASQWIVAGIVSFPFLFDIQPYCVFPRWMTVYTLIIAIIVPALITLMANLCIFKYAYSSSRRIRAQIDTTSGSVTVSPRRKISRRDTYLLGHTFFMFGMFIIGWGPIFSLVAIDYSGNVIPLVYTILQILAVISLFGCMVDLFLFNHELRRYIKKKMCRCF